MSLEKIVAVNVRKVVAPFSVPPKTATGTLTDAAMVLIDLETESGIVGRSYLFAFSPLFLTPLAATVESLGSLIIGDALAPLSLEKKLRSRLKLIDTPGLIGLALAGIDMAAWDAHAKTYDLPLAQLLGSDVTEVQAYNSCGLWIDDTATLADEAEALLASNDFQALKLRIGREDARADLAAIRQVVNRIGDNVHLMVDYNQSQTVSSAMERMRVLDNEGLYWIEEPIRHADYKGSAQIARAMATPLQTGENLCGDFELQCAIDAGAANLYMPDVQRIGGVSGWLRAAALCNANGFSMSSHLFPEVSVHLLAATPTSHWLEYVNWADPLLEKPLEVLNGMAQIPSRPGIGIEWNEEAVARYQV